MPLPTPPADVAAALAAAAEEYAIPVAYLQSMAWHESRYLAHLEEGAAVGLLQIVPRWVGDYEAATGEVGVGDRLTDAPTNARVGAWMIRTIVNAWRHRHPHTLLEDWSDPRWVRLLAFGVGAGWSDRPIGGGVGAVVSLLERLGYERDRVTVQAVQANAARARAVEFVRSRGRMNHAIATAREYFELEGIEAPAPAPFAGAGGADADVSAPSSPSSGSSPLEPSRWPIRCAEGSPRAPDPASDEALGGVPELRGLRMELAGIPAGPSSSSSTSSSNVRRTRRRPGGGRAQAA